MGNVGHIFTNHRDVSLLYIHLPRHNSKEHSANGEASSRTRVLEVGGIGCEAQHLPISTLWRLGNWSGWKQKLCHYPFLNQYIYMYKLCITFELPSLETIPCWERMKQLSNPQEGLVIRSTGSNTHTHNKTHEDFFLKIYTKIDWPSKIWPNIDWPQPLVNIHYWCCSANSRLCRLCLAHSPSFQQTQWKAIPKKIPEMNLPDRNRGSVCYPLVMTNVAIENDHL